MDCRGPCPCPRVAGWLYVYATTGWLCMLLGASTLLAGAAAFLAWSRARGEWPFAPRDVPIGPGSAGW